METSFNYCDKEEAYFSSDERKWISRIRRLQGKYPDKVFILKQPEENDGCIYCRLPVSALSLNLRASKPLTEEQRQARIANLARARQSRNNT